MVLGQRSGYVTSSRDRDAFPTTQLLLLCEFDINEHGYTSTP